MLGKRFGGRVQPHRGLKSLVTLGKSRTVLRFSPRCEQGPGWLHLGLSNLSLSMLLSLAAGSSDVGRKTEGGRSY